MSNKNLSSNAINSEEKKMKKIAKKDNEAVDEVYLYPYCIMYDLCKSDIFNAKQKLELLMALYHVTTYQYSTESHKIAKTGMTDKYHDIIVGNILTSIIGIASEIMRVPEFVDFATDTFAKNNWPEDGLSFLLDDMREKVIKIKKEYENENDDENEN